MALPCRCRSVSLRAVRACACPARSDSPQSYGGATPLRNPSVAADGRSSRSRGGARRPDATPVLRASALGGGRTPVALLRRPLGRVGGSSRARGHRAPGFLDLHFHCDPGGGATRAVRGRARARRAADAARGNDGLPRHDRVLAASAALGGGRCAGGGRRRSGRGRGLSRPAPRRPVDQRRGARRDGARGDPALPRVETASARARGRASGAWSRARTRWTAPTHFSTSSRSRRDRGARPHAASPARIREASRAAAPRHASLDARGGATTASRGVEGHRARGRPAQSD